MMQQKELFEKLVEKTRALGRQVTFGEFDQDEALPRANTLAYYYGSFGSAAEEAWSKVRMENAAARGPTRMETEVRQMAKKKRLQMDDERKERVIEEFVEMYIKNDGRMPTNRMVKKNPYITEEEVGALYRTGDLAESRVRKRAERKTGRKFLSPQERRTQEMLTRYGADKKPQATEPETKVEPKAEAKVESEVKAEPEKLPLVEATEPEPAFVEVAKEQAEQVVEQQMEVKRMRGHRVSKEDVLENLRAVMEKLGRLPTQLEISVHEAGAKYAYQTYVDKLGPKSNWAKILEAEQTNEAEDVEVTEAESLAEAEENLTETAEGDWVELAAAEEPIGFAAELADMTAEVSEATEAGDSVAVAATEVVNEEAEEVASMEMRMIEIPVKVILPKGIKGKVTLTLELD